MSLSLRFSLRLSVCLFLAPTLQPTEINSTRNENSLSSQIPLIQKWVRNVFDFQEKKKWTRIRPPFAKMIEEEPSCALCVSLTAFWRSHLVLRTHISMTKRPPETCPCGYNSTEVIRWPRNIRHFSDTYIT